MKDRDVAELVRMAVEIDEIEQIASAGASGAPSAKRWRYLGREAPRDRILVDYKARHTLHPLWRIAVPAAAAAACVLALLHPRAALDSRRAAATVPFQIIHCPGERLDDGLRIDSFEPTASEYCVVLAIFHTWRDDCQCLSWQLHEWEDGGMLAEFAPGQRLDITLDVTDAPPVEQLLVMAVAQNPDDLPSTIEETYGLMDCLNEVRPPTDPCESAAAYASAVEACLPEGVRVIPQPFYVE